MTEENDSFDRLNTMTRMNALDERGFVIVVTRAFGPNGEDLMDQDGPDFSGERGVRVHVKQGDLEEDVLLSPYFGDPTKISEVPFEVGKPCDLYVSGTDTLLDKVPGMKTDDGGEFFAVYLTSKLGKGEMVAINNIWGDATSQMLSEGELLKLIVESELADQ